MYNKVRNKQLFNVQRKRQNAGNKLRTYRTIKTNIKTKTYTQILDQKQRQISCKFRILSNDLEIENGRYYQMEPEKRICILCNVEVEDKMHFLLKCSKIVSEYDQEIPQSQTTDNPVAPRGRATQTSRDTRRTN